MHPSLLELANDQAGALSRAQVIGGGGTDEVIEARLVADRWQRLHPGVFLTHAGPVPRLAEIWGGLLCEP
ncbi:MAG: hypothetical protein ACRDMV_05370 [Streptosporangiales bacterium]